MHAANPTAIGFPGFHVYYPYGRRLEGFVQAIVQDLQLMLHWKGFTRFFAQKRKLPRDLRWVNLVENKYDNECHRM